MSNFIFNAAVAALTAATLDLSTGNYYAHLVTTAPLLTDSTVANLVVPTVGGYASTVLTGLSDNSQRWTFDSFLFPRYIFATNPPVGVVICKRAGAAPVASDQVICYSDFLNSISQVILTPVGAYLISLSFGANGAINKTYRYQYNSGAYVAGADGGYPKGLIFLLGSSNNTVVFANPVPSKIACICDPAPGNNFTFTERSTNGFFHTDIAFDFLAYRVKVSALRYLRAGSVATGSSAVTIYGSNNLPDWNISEVQNIANWTSLAAVASPNSNPTGWIEAITTNSTYWRYLRWSATTQLEISEIELYESSILSPTLNMI